MKRLIIPLTIILFTISSQAQLLMVDENGEYNYTDVIQQKDLSKSQLKERAKKWIHSYYNNNDSIFIDSNGIKQKESFKFSWKFIKKNIPLELFYDLSIKCKDNKYKYEFSNFMIGKKVNDQIDATELKTYIERFPEKYQIYIEEPIDAEIMSIIENLEYFLTNNKMKLEDDDW